MSRVSEKIELKSKKNRFEENSQKVSFEHVWFETFFRYTSEKNEELVSYMSVIPGSDLNKLFKMSKRI